MSFSGQKDTVLGPVLSDSQIEENVKRLICVYQDTKKLPVSDEMLSDECFYRLIKFLSDEAEKKGVPLTDYVNLPFDLEESLFPQAASSDLSYRRTILSISVASVVQIYQSSETVNNRRRRY